MMVNETNHQQHTSWQRNVPDQMPWMTNSTPPILNSGIIQFGLNSDPVAPSSSPGVPTSNTINNAFNDTCPTINNNSVPFSNLNHENLLSFMPPQCSSVGSHLQTNNNHFDASSGYVLKAKRTSMEMCGEDEYYGLSQDIGPPSKQWLSENVMMRQFDSLNLTSSSSSSSSSLTDGNDSRPRSDALVDDGSSDDDDDTIVTIDDPTTSDNTISLDTDLDRYVYMIFNDKTRQYKRNFIGSSSSSIIDRLSRHEMDRMHKAVVLWSPNPLATTSEVTYPDDDDDDDIAECDIDFLSNQNNMIITEVSDGEIIGTESVEGVLVSEPISPSESIEDFSFDDDKDDDSDSMMD